MTDTFSSVSHLDNGKLGNSLVDYISNNEIDKAFMLLDSIKKSKSVSDLNEIINQRTYGKFKDRLLEHSIRHSQYAMCKLLINRYSCICTDWGFFLACSINNFEIAKLLLDNGAKPNAVSSQKKSCLHFAAEHGNLTLIKLLKDAKFDFKLIKMGKDQVTVFWPLIFYNHLECLKYIVQWSKELGDDSYKLVQSCLYERDSHNSDALKVSTERGFYELTHYLVTELKILDNNDIKYNVLNETNVDGDSVVWGIAYVGNLEIMDLIVGKDNKYKADINKCSNDGSSPLFIAAKRNHSKCVRYLLQHKDFDVKVLNLKNNESISPLVAAITNGHIGVVKELCQHKELMIDINTLSHCCKKGQTKILRYLLKVLIFDKRDDGNTSNVNSSESKKWWDILMKDNIFTSSFLADMIDLSNNEHNIALYDFLIELQSIYDSKDPNHLEKVLKFEIDTVAQRNIQAKCEVYIRDRIAVRTFLDGLSESSRKEINKKITSMIEKKETLNDTLLLMQDIIDSDCLTNNIVNAAKDCFSSSQLKDEKEDKNKKNEDEKYMEDEKMFKKEWFFRNIGQNNILATSNIFKNITENVLNNEISKQEEMIKNEWEKEMKIDNESCQQLMNKPFFNNTYYHDLQQNKYNSMYDSQVNRMAAKGISSKYKENELMIDLNCGFDAAQEYDSNVIGTLLVIDGYKINTKFQNECKNFFNESNLGVKCNYKSGSVKQLNRIQNKAELDYNRREYPHCMSVVDIVRGSVICDNSKDLLAVMSTFENRLRNFKYIKEIVRIKNGFSGLKNDKYEYCDIKMNVLVETEGNIMICEIQFNLNWMLKIKKIGHTFYKLLREEEMFNQINIMSNNINENKNIESAIIRQDFNKMYQLLVDKKLIFKLDDDTRKQLESSNKYFPKGAKFYQSYINYIANHSD